LVCLWHRQKEKTPAGLFFGFLPGIFFMLRFLDAFLKPGKLRRPDFATGTTPAYSKRTYLSCLAFLHPTGSHFIRYCYSNSLIGTYCGFIPGFVHIDCICMVQSYWTVRAL
jgi:hypothetical protein